MEMTTLLAWLEVMSTIAVLLTLVYLARQVRQENVLLKSESYQAQLAMDQEHIYKFIDHPDLAKTFAGKESRTDEEKTRMYFWITASMRAREFEWMQYASGSLDKEAWESYRNVIYFTLGTERARQYWAVCQSFFSPGFVAVVNDMIAGAPVTDYWDQIEKIT